MGEPVSISTMRCQACVERPNCFSTLPFTQGDLNLTPKKKDFSNTRLEPFVASLNRTPCSEEVFSALRSALSDFNVC